MLKVVILGSGDMLCNLISGIIDSNTAQIVGVFRAENLRKSRIKQTLKDYFIPSKELNYVKSLKLNDMKFNSANSEEFKRAVLKLNPDIILVGMWGEKLKKDIIDLPKLATINTHPSLLPTYRGPNPYLQIIKHQETKSGVTFHLMNEKFDAGAILAQDIVDVSPSDTGKELKEKIVLQARSTVARLINSLDNDVIIPLSQDENKASYYPQIKSTDVMLNFDMPAKAVAAHIRAFHPWTKCYFSHKNQFFYPNPYKISIIENNIDLESGVIIKVSHDRNSFAIVCKDNNLIVLEDLKLYGKIKKYLTKFYIKYFVKEGDKVY